ncbi:MAG: zinc ribbon domain-containing protein [Thermoproteota archaeon]|nr:zinc ribbon domain-containing protein [Thermoproteota archaeon]
MSFGVDTLGGLTEKLKQLINDTQNLYESFIDANQLYKQGKMGDKEFFIKIGEYLVSTSALNFLAVRVILEIKNAMEKGTSVKSPTGASSSSTTAPQAGFGIGGFVGAGGMVGPAGTSDNEYTLPSPQEPTFKPVDIELPKSRVSSTTKNCVACNTLIPTHAKFCRKCGRPQ